MKTRVIGTAAWGRWNLTRTRPQRHGSLIVAAYRNRKWGTGPGRRERIESLCKGCISSERGVGPGEARQQQRAPGAERGAKERWAGARLWPRCPGIRLPLRSGRDVGGFRSKVRSKPHFDSLLVHWLSDLQPRINSRTCPTWEMGQCFPGFSTQNP